MADSVALADRHRVVCTCLVYQVQGANRKIPFYLAIKRHPGLKIFPGLWTLPGGGMNAIDYRGGLLQASGGWESPLDFAVRREVKEETAIEVGELEYLNNFAFIRDDDVPVFGVRFAAPYLSGEVVLDPNDSVDYAWVNAEGLDVSDFEFLGNIPNVIRAFDKRLRARL